MLEYLSVKNYALIREAHIDFKNNLNVFTGETGSGKSILIGSINLALGMRASKDFKNDENDDTIINLSFIINDDSLISYLRSIDINVEADNRIIIYRKISKDKSLIKINDDVVTLSKLKEVAEKLIDIYGQHDGEDLRKNSKHIKFLDDFIGAPLLNLKKEISALYDEYKKSIEILNNFNIDEKMRLREIDILKYEINELENANLKVGEEEELANKFKMISNSKNIIESLNNAMNILQEANVSKSLKEIKNATKYDESLNNIYSELIDCDSIITDCVKELDKKINNYEIDEKEYAETEERLNFIRNLLSKYDNSIDKANNELIIKKERLNKLLNYDKEKENAKNKLNVALNNLEMKAKELTQLRVEKAADFEKKMLSELEDLGFIDVKFEIQINKKSEVSRDGMDDVIFLVSLNVGEKLRPLSEVASGGELSRIMLSIKTILSNSYGTDTLIFDEIDAGISGITAAKVAVKLNKIAKYHQVILITHLPQIAAMADNHFVIKKEVKNNKTETIIETLDEMGMIYEIGRLIGSNGKLSDSVFANAKELKMNAKKEKIQ